MRPYRVRIVASSFLAAFIAAHSAEQATGPVLEEQAGSCLLQSGDRRLGVSLRCPEVQLADNAGAFGGDAPSKIEPADGKDGCWVCTYKPAVLASKATIERELHVAWSPEERVLRKWLRLRPTHTSGPVTIREITLESIIKPAFSREFRPGPPQSYPLFLQGFFAGIEFPVASTQVRSNQAVLAHRPLCELTPGAWYESRRAVYGQASPGDEVLAFHRYIEAHRPAPKGMHFNYNSWWTSPVPFSESDILGLMKQFEDNLFKKHGTALDSFTIDMGWSDPNGVWEIDRKLFPAGFTKIREGAEAMGGRLGLWCSPSSCYAPAVNPQWALDHGYESFEIPGTQTRLLSLAGEKYRNKYASSIAGMVRQFDLRQVKLDGLYLGREDYMAGAWPSEATAAGAAEAFDAMRAAGTNVWLEATYSAYASPWWLFHVNSVIGGFGDDSPNGRVPCPVYRESYTTARDYYNLQSADRLPSPIPAQEILGVIHQSDDSFMNDAVTTVLRGHAFISLYVNPKYMNDRRWAMLAGLVKWSRAHSGRLTAPNTQPLRPASWLREGIPWQSHTAPMPREPYGYAHWGEDEGLVVLRNPWVEKQSYALKVDLSAQGPVHSISLYPEPRLYGMGLEAGQILNVSLAPYETVVLSFAAGAPPKALPRAEDAVGKALSRAVSSPKTVMRRVVYETPKPPLGLDYTSLAPASGTTAEIHTDFQLQPLARGARVRVLALFEGETVPDADGKLLVNGDELPLRSIRSDTGFVASGARATQSWNFLEGVLPGSGGKASLRLSAQDSKAIVSIWLLADKPGESSAASSETLPAPERISFDSLCILKPTLLVTAVDVEHKDAPVERIKGVFLDSMDPVSIKQGWGTLKKNRSVWDREMIIGETHFRRGLGTHANSEIVYHLDGKYRRFQAWAGPDMATRGTVGLAVIVDGKKAWESGKMSRGEAPKRVDIDVAGARELRLLVDDTGDNIMGDHADWADARLLY